MEFNAVCTDLEKTPSCDHEGLQLEVTQHKHSLRHVANIIVALQRMKHSHTPRGTEFSDADLICIMLENDIEVCPTSLLESASAPRAFIRRSKHEVPMSVCDRGQKSLVLQETPLELQAVVLQGGNMDLKVNLNQSTYRSTKVVDGLPVALGIAGRNLYLSCSEVDGAPTLQLEEVTDVATLQTINAQGAMARFLFLKKEDPNTVNHTTLESFKHPNWFISTAAEEDKMPVEMSQEGAPARNNIFSIKTL